MKAYDECVKNKKLKRDNMEKGKETKEFVWTDELRKEFITGYENNKISSLEAFKKSKEPSKAKEKPLFIADDGIGIYANDPYYEVLPDWSIRGWRSDFGTTLGVRATFSTERAAKEYVINNQPKYSLGYIRKLYEAYLHESNNIVFHQEFMESYIKDNPQC